MTKVRVAVLDDYQLAARACADFSVLEEHAEVQVFSDHIVDQDRLVERLAGFEVVIAMRERTPFPAALLNRLPRLRLLVTTAMVNASIDMAAAGRLGMVVCGTRGFESTTSEFVWGLILALTRRIVVESTQLRSGRWQTTLGTELAGSTIGIVGLGEIGRDIARYARTFNMRVIAWSQNLTEPDATARGAELVTKDELFERSDIVTVHLRLSERTRGLVGAHELALLGPRGYLVNTSRGPIVDQQALVRALHDGTIAGAALDVFETEPLPPDHPLLGTPNTLLTPHIGFVARRSYECFYGDAVEDVLAWLRGSPIRRLN